MSESITLADKVYKEVASYGNRDESHNTIVLRLLNNLNEEEAKEDRENRITVFEEQEEKEEEKTQYPILEKLEDGTTVRWKLDRGEYAGQQRNGTVEGGRIAFGGGTWSSSGFAREADKDIRADDARSSESYRGPSEVEYENENGEWVPLNTV